MNKVIHEQSETDSATPPPPIPIRILMLEDSSRDAELCFRELSKAGFKLQTDVVDSQEAFAAKIRSQIYDVVLSDYGIPGWSGIEAFQLLKRSGKDVPFILVTGSLGEEAAVDLIKDGVDDYILKDRLARLPSAIHRVLREKTSREERERALQAVQASEARTRRLVDSNIIGIAIGDIAGKLLDANGAFLKLLGCTLEELLAGDMRWDTITPAEYRESDERAAEQLKTTGIASPWEKEFVRKDGGRVSVLIGATTLVGGDGSLECVSFVLDLSERKELEQQLRQAQKMEAIGLLAGGIAHDFNNLLGVIIGWSEVFEDRLAEGDPLRPKAEQIKKAGQRAASLTRQLLAFSRRQVLEPTVLDLGAVVTDTSKMLQRLIGDDIELVTILTPDLGRVRADKGQVEQVVMNLAVNARDAMPEGGKLTITIASAELDEVTIRQHPEANSDTYIMLQVSDTGCGMDPETQLRIFDPFFTTKGIGKGTGLGLSTVYGVVKQSGGYISVHSELGRGTSFKIYLPRVDESIGNASPDDDAEKSLMGSETILLVEDADALRELACELLEDAGYTVLAAANSMEAIQLAEKHNGSIQLLLTDVVMPGMGGMKLAEQMTRIHPGIKVLYVSGYTDDAIAHHGVLDSGVALLQKPFTKNSLTSKLREVLGVGKKPKPKALADPGARGEQL
jgi:two-component system cell cycle sensor histidine kinase/response regulator CckA